MDHEDDFDYSSMLAGSSTSTGKMKGKFDWMRTDGEDEEDWGNDTRALAGPSSSFSASRASRGDTKGEATSRDLVVGSSLSRIPAASSSGGTWQSLGLNPSLVKTMNVRGFKTPTPIQRASIPYAVGGSPRDLVGMARTGSGKTLAYMLPLFQRLGNRHSTSFGARALILCPGRELALQIIRVGKDIARGMKQSKAGKHPGDDNVSQGREEDVRSEDLRWGLVVGGEGLDEQFSMITSNPDVIIATPGRLLHLIVEMDLDLRSVEYLVFDEADRLFEMGFQIQLQEILHRLPPNRQTMLFSATLPGTLVEFAKAGLTNPKLIRLDAESKISNDLQMAFFAVAPGEKEAALLSLLKDVIRVPMGSENGAEGGADAGKRKRKLGGKSAAAPNQAIVFAATKHHVEYLSTLLEASRYTVSHIYGNLDQTARKEQMDRFRLGEAQLLVVTDVAARGIDIPVLANVINYDFPTGARVFVHRVGRTARAGQRGWAYSFVTGSELPYLLDLQLFLGRPLVPPSQFGGEQAEYTSSLVYGHIPRDNIDAESEYIGTTLLHSAPTLPVLKEVVRKGQAMYERSQGKASQESYRRAKAMMKDPVWGLQGLAANLDQQHPVYKAVAEKGGAKEAEVVARNAILARVGNFRPQETVFETGNRGKSSPAAEVMKQRRETMQRYQSKHAKGVVPAGEEGSGTDVEMGDDDQSDVDMNDTDVTTFPSVPRVSRSAPIDYRDQAFYMSHTRPEAAAERGYSLTDGQSFTEQARNATFDLVGDDGVIERTQRASQLTWDRKKRKFVKGDGTGSDNKKLVKTESGAKLPASFKSGRFDEWKSKNRTSMPKVGEAEGPANGRSSRQGPDGKHYRHQKITAAKPLDPKSTTYEKKVYVAKKRAEKAGDPAPGGRPGKGQARNELRDVSDIRKARQIQEQRRAKNARPSKKGGKGKGKGRR